MGDKSEPQLSPDRIKALYHEARAAENRQDLDTAEKLYRSIVDLYQNHRQEPSINLAVSLYQLACFASVRKEYSKAADQMRQSSEVFRRVAQAAEVRGNVELAQKARFEAKDAWRLAESFAGGTSSGGTVQSGASPTRAKQEEFLRHLDEQRARLNEIWAQGLGRI